MSTRTRMIAGLALALAVGLFGPALVAVATHSGGGQGSIAGTVTDQYGEPALTCVRLYVHGGDAPHHLESTRTRSDGTYVFRSLRYGSYALEYGACDNLLTIPRFVPEWYDDEPTFRTADAVVIGTQEEPVTGIDASITEL